MPPPSSGAIAIAQIFGILDKASTSANFLSADWLHRYANAAHLALADRAQYVADPDFVAPPAGDWHSLVAPDYLLSRVKSISKQAAPNQPEHGTSHISIVDGFGNALAMTTTIEYAWGSHLMVNRGKLDADGKPILGGFLLNNQLTDFSFTPTDANGKLIANRVEAGKRPRSSMSPTLVFDKATGQLAASVGSPGGELIIHYVAKTLYGMLNWQLSPQDAINLPNFAVMDRTIVLEKDRFPAATIEALKARGHFVVESPLTSGLQGIQKTPVGWLGGADPRREGVVLGD
jgi:gamma-glutamyltranspeptidase / glutathione hydrolase